MFDQSFNETSLSREIRKSDFRKYRALHNDSERQKQITDACTRGKDGFPDLSAFTISTIRGKCVVKVPKFSDELTLRKINANILKLANIRMMDRDSIVANIEALLSEGIQYRIYRLDIKSFYESISLADISSRIESIKFLSSPSKRHILDILLCFQRSGRTGIPRGLSVSATLSELILSDFDKKISSHAEVFYFSRYVDDIILITSGDENRRKFTKLIKSWLPTGLTLNSKKQVIKERSRVHNEKGAAAQAINTK
ncbi:antiviral reverse transcriptase Drt3a [Pseudomonas carnis]|nr:antiviral reverse transcriptase Drt3a [Pseudomonas carnis]